MATAATKITPKQQRFADEYLIDLNATAAYKRAGYAGKGNTAEVCASQLLSNPKVAQYVQEAIKARAARTEITQDRVLKELARIAFFDIRKLYGVDGSLKPMHELDDEAAAVLAGVDVVEMQGGMKVDLGDGQVSHVPMYTKKAKVFDKGTALTLAMRHLGMLTDKQEISGPNGGPVEVVDPVRPKLSKEEWLAAHGVGTTTRPAE
jgi:phage terminase small subunit